FFDYTKISVASNQIHLITNNRYFRTVNAQDLSGSLRTLLPQKTPPDLHPGALLDFKRKLVGLSKLFLV
ncbi:hypothetical protein, partial [Levilactobacillus cerevisiae]|uniref:hypothetical protein n=1 Tax=Levilactobacillus cerevisiae TaxID=1704076 RepID=UPI001CDBDA42